MITFQRGIANLRDFRVEEGQDRKRATTLVLNGQSLGATRRFWQSFCSRFALSDTVFKYFNHDEVFQRIVDVRGDTPLRYTIEATDNDDKLKLLAIVAEDTNVVEAEDVDRVFSRFQAVDQRYHEGFMSARFIPKSGEFTQPIGGDEFRNRFVMEVPIDGWGKPKTFLELLRLVCTNGAMGMTASFQSTLPMGKDPQMSLERCLGTYDDGEGFTKLRDRFSMAQRSWASMREMTRFTTLLERIPDQDLKMLVAPRLDQVFGDMGRIYGVINCNALPIKLQQRLETKATVYDLVNLCSELATHHANEGDARLFQGFIGELISDDYDLQGTIQTPMEFKDFLLVKA